MIVRKLYSGSITYAFQFLTREAKWSAPAILKAYPRTAASLAKICGQSRYYSKIPKGATAQGLRRSPITQQSAVPDTLHLRSCTTASTCEIYDIKALVRDNSNHRERPAARFLVPHEIAYFSLSTEHGKSADVFVLKNGTVVAWGLGEQQMTSQVVPMLKDYEIRSYKDTETEDMDFFEDEENDKSRMVGEVIYIGGESDKDRIINKAAFSSGLSRSTKLAALEMSLDKFMATIKGISDRMVTGSLSKLSSNDVLKITGRLLQIRGQLNLHSELIETPDLYWSEPELEAIYSLISRKLDISPRIAILNKKLDYASELVGILQTHISEQQSVRLEWMIIVLIMVEVAFEITHFVDSLMLKKEEKELADAVAAASNTTL